jgi:hypothetical protein
MTGIEMIAAERCTIPFVKEKVLRDGQVFRGGVYLGG